MFLVASYSLAYSFFITWSQRLLHLNFYKLSNERYKLHNMSRKYLITLSQNVQKKMAHSEMIYEKYFFLIAIR